MDNIPIDPLFAGMESSFIFSLEDVKAMRQTNKMFCKEIDLWRYISKVFETNHDLFYECIETQIDIDGHDRSVADVFRECDIRIMEIDRILGNMKIVNARKKGEKYGHLMQQYLFRIRHISSHERWETCIENTLILLKALHAYAEMLLESQDVFTDLPKYVALWLSDYLDMVYISKTGSFQHDPLQRLIYIKNAFDCDWNHWNFYEASVDLDVEMTIYAKNINEFINGIICLADLVGKTKIGRFRNKRRSNVFKYILNTIRFPGGLEMLRKGPRPEEMEPCQLYLLICNKVQEVLITVDCDDESIRICRELQSLLY